MTSSLDTLLLKPRSEAELLLSCVRPQLDSAIFEQIQTVLQRSLDWNYLLQMVEKHRVLPLFYRNLHTSCAASVPPHILRELRSRFYENAVRNLLLTNELLHILQLFQAQQIRVIPYKGTILAASAYGKVSLRQVWDLDILVAEADVARSRALLLEQGYEIKDTQDREQSFFHNEREVEVDLHWGLTPVYFPIKLDFDLLWCNRQPLTLAETVVYSFAPEDLLLILCIQVAKDCWERRQHLEHLAKVCDIAALLHSCPTLNWVALMQQAKHMGAERMVNFGLYLAQGLSGANLPQSVNFIVHSDLIAISLAQQVCARLFSTIDESFASTKNSYLDLNLRMNQLRFYWRMRECPKHRVQHIWEIVRNLGSLQNH